MLAKKSWIIVGVLGFCITWATVAEAQIKLPFKRKTANRSELVGLQQSHGPWLVMCASFTGEQGLQQAKQLATELKTSHGLNAYLYRHQFDHSNKIVGSAWEAPADEMSWPEQKKWQSASQETYDRIAVLVGDFSDLKDAAAIDALKKIKRIVPRSMSSNEYVGTNQAIEQQHRARNGGSPLAAAFLLPNPLLPPDYFRARNIDATLVKANKGKKHSLLKCKGRYSVRVATFTGESKFNADAAYIERKRREQAALLKSGEAITKSDLADATYKADVLCRALRKKGVEAYQYHDRHESYVCVGSFDKLGDGRENQSGKSEMNPEIAKVIQQYKATTQMTSRGPIIVTRTIRALKEFNINFDAQPMPILVPKTKSKGFLGR